MCCSSKFEPLSGEFSVPAVGESASPVASSYELFPANFFSQNRRMKEDISVKVK